MASNTVTAGINIFINNKEVENNFRSIRNAITQARNALAGMTIGSSEYFEETKKIRQLQAALQEHYKHQRKIANGWLKVRNSVKQIAVGNIIANSLSSVAGSIQGAFSKIIDGFSNFEKGYTNVLTLLEDDEIEKFSAPLRKGAKEVIKLGFKVNDTNKALFDAISAGVAAGDSIEFLKQAAVLAKGGVTNLATAVDGTTSILNAYKLATSETGEVSAAFFSAQKAGKTTVAELASNIGKLAPLAASAGVGYKELLSATAALTKGGISTSESITYIKAALAGLIKPSKEAEVVLRKFNVPVGASEIQSEGLAGTLVKLNEIIKQHPNEIAKAIPSVEALTAVQALSGKGLDEFSKILKTVQTDIGNTSSLNKAYKKQMASFPNVMAAAREQLNVLAITIGEKLAPYIQQVVPLISGWTKKVVKLIDYIVKNGDSTKYLVKEIAVGIVVYKSFIAFQKLSALWTDKLSTKTKRLRFFVEKLGNRTERLSKKMKILNKTARMLPQAFVMLAVASLAKGILDLTKSFTRLTAKQKSVLNFQKKVNESIADDAVQLDLFNNRLKEVNKGQGDRLKLIEDINKQYGEYLPALLTEKSTSEEIATALQNINTNLKLKIEFQAATEMSVNSKKNKQIAQKEIEDFLKENDFVFTGAFGKFKDVTDKVFDIFSGRAIIDQIMGVKEKKYFSDLQRNLKEASEDYDYWLKEASALGKKMEKNKPKPIITPEINPNGNNNNNNNKGKGKGKGNKDKEREIELLKKYKTAYEAMRKKIIDIRRQYNLEELSEEDKVLQAIIDKYQEQLDVVNGFIQELEEKKVLQKGKLNDKEQELLNKFYNQQLDLIELKENEISKKEKEFAEKRKAEKEKLKKAIEDLSKSEKEKEIEAIEKKYEKMIELAEKHGLDTFDIYKKMFAEIDAIGEKYKDNKENTDIFGIDWEKIKADFEELTTYTNSAVNLFGEFSQLQQNQEQSSLQNYRKLNEQKHVALEKRLKAGRISEKQYRHEIAKADKELDEQQRNIARKQALRERAMRSYETIINTAAAIIKFMVNPSGPKGVILSAMAAATGAVQLARINSAPIPKFAKGGRVYSPTVGLIGEAGPEIVLSSKIVQNKKYGAIADDLARIQEGKTPRLLNKPPNPNYQLAGERLLSSTTNNITNNTNNTIVKKIDNAEIKSMKEEIKSMNLSIQQMSIAIEKMKNIKAIITNDQLKENEEYQRLREQYSRF